LFFQTVHHPLCKNNPPSVKYRRLFLSELIKRHEASAAEPLDDVYDALAAVLGAEEEPVCHKSYLLPSGDFVIVSESVPLISEGTTGLVTWEAALHLAEWALENLGAFSGRSVLELGSGAGLAGLVVCRACSPRRYTFSDCHPSVLQRLHGNVHLNGLAPRRDPCPGPAVSVEELDWEAVTSERLQEFEADTVIASDVVYDPDIVCCLVRLLSKILQCPPQGRCPDVYVASTVRNPETYGLFKSELSKAAIRHQAIPGPERQVFPYNRTTTIEILKLY
ncbi:EF2KT methyltransferase, partial [Amia calva]|nr:EF2KT methyltransferase [Amia calva]